MKKRVFAVGLPLLLLVALSLGCYVNGVEATPSPTPALPSGKLLSVAYLDVGQGDCIFVQTPNGKTMLIDAGEAAARESIDGYIAKMGIAKIDVLIATHPHADHIGGMAYVVEHYKTGAVYMPKATSTSSAYRKLMGAIEKRGVKVNTAQTGVDIWLDEDLVVSVLAPLKSSYANVNDCSVVLKITYRQTTFLFMGDASEVSEQEMMQQNEDVDSDVIKVGHHGSATSSSKEFLNAVSPDYAVISVGQKNAYGHPSKSVLLRLGQAGARIYRTDLDGTVVITSDGNVISIVNPVSRRRQKEKPWVAQCNCYKKDEYIIKQIAA